MLVIALQILCIILVAIAMSLSLAHALEWPGKMRLGKDAYVATHAIYYPGFTVGGAAEPLGILALLALTFVTPAGSTRWLALGALVFLAAAHAAYWLLTHPVNNFWLRDYKLAAAGSGFFSFAARNIDMSDWKALRDRWEMSHLIRAIFAGASFILLVIAVAIGP
jgi:hypothetical protein